MCIFFFLSRLTQRFIENHPTCCKVILASKVKLYTCTLWQTHVALSVSSSVPCHPMPSCPGFMSLLFAHQAATHDAVPAHEQYLYRPGTLPNFTHSTLTQYSHIPTPSPVPFTAMCVPPTNSFHIHIMLSFALRDLTAILDTSLPVYYQICTEVKYLATLLH